MTKVIIFGASGYGLYALYSLDDAKYEVLCFIDNNKDLQGKTYCGHYVDAPENIDQYDFDYIILPIADYAESMRAQLTAPPLLVKPSQFVESRPNTDGIVWDDLRTAMLRRCIEEIKENNVQGSLAELGVYTGDFAKYINRYMPDRKLYLFDTFTGFDVRDKSTKDHELEDIENWFQNTSVQTVLEKMVKRESCIIKKGYFPETAVGLENETYCLVSLDSDLYKPILAGLEYFYPRLVPGGYIFVHDFSGGVFKAGVKKAVREYCSKQNISYVPILDRQGSVIIAK